VLRTRLDKSQIVRIDDKSDFSNAGESCCGAEHMGFYMSKEARGTIYDVLVWNLVWGRPRPKQAPLRATI
jgi:hypothetical protein